MESRKKAIMLSALNEIKLHYSHLSNDTAADLFKCWNIREYKKGDIIVNEGSTEKVNYFVYKGIIRAYFIKDFKEVTLRFFTENSFFISLEPCLLNMGSNVAVEAIENTLMLEMTKENADYLCKKHHDFETLSRVIANQNLLFYQQRLMSLQYGTADERYKALLNELPFIIERVPLNMIASSIGITSETLSRIRKKIVNG